MAIRAPHWAKGAVPTTKGWMVKGELVKSQKISEADIAEWKGEGVVQSLTESPVVHTPLEDLGDHAKDSVLRHFFAKSEEVEDEDEEKE